MHADDGRAQNGWRNTLAFDPLKPLAGFSFYQAVLAPITDALSRVLDGNATAWLSLQVWGLRGDSSREWLLGMADRTGGGSRSEGPPACTRRQGSRHAVRCAGRDGGDRLLLPLAVGRGGAQGERAPCASAMRTAGCMLVAINQRQPMCLIVFPPAP